MPRATIVVAAAGAGVFLSAAASAQDAPAVKPESLTVQSALATERDARPSEISPRQEFGAAGSQWWTVGGSVGNDFADSTDVGAFAAFTYFLIDDVEITGQLGVRYYTQPGDDALAVTPQVIFRWHFVNTGAWTVFAEAGIGLMGSTDNVPFDGTSFNFTPRVGFGFTRRLTDDGVRLIAGLVWSHVSNARIQGDSKNPGLDEPMLYLGIVWPF